MHLKKVVIVVLALLFLTASLAGCGSQTAPAAGGTTQEAAAPAESQAAPEAGGDEAVTITYAPQMDPSTATKSLIAAFEAKYPNIKVNFQEMPAASDQLHNTYVTALTAGDESIDVLSVDVIWPSEFASAGWLRTLDDKFPKAEQEKFFPGPLQAVSYQGKIYAMPRYTDSGVLYYRKDIIKDPPKTWEELIQLCKDNIGKNGIKNGFVFQGNQYEGFICNALEYINGNGGSILTDGKVSVNTPQVKQGLQYMKDIITGNIAPQGITTYKENEATAVYQQGETLFMRNWTSAWVLLNKDESAVKDKVGVTQIPIGKDGKESSPTLGGWNMAINMYSKHPEEAWKFIEFATGLEGQKITALEAGKIPTRKDLFDDKDILAKNPFWENFYDGFLTSKSRPVSPVYPKISDTMQINFHKAVTGGMPIDEAVANVEKDLNVLIK